MTESLIQGFALGLSLIMAIGAQNAFVLKQGLKGEYVFWVCLTCALSDAILISIGVLLLSAIENYIPKITQYATYFGAIFLFLYGLRSFVRAYQKQNNLEPDKRGIKGFLPIILTCIALTWLNPHVYLDTVILLGSISIQYGENSVWFGLGAIVASFVFFFTLGYGASLLRPLFSKPITWSILDILIGLVMWAIAYSLLS